MSGAGVLPPSADVPTRRAAVPACRASASAGRAPVLKLWRFDQAVAVVAQDRVIATSANPTERQGRYPDQTPLAVLVIPCPLTNGVSAAIVRTSLVQNQDLLSAFDRTPARKAGSTPELASGGVGARRP